jgi:hypothetical protein
VKHFQEQLNYKLFRSSNQASMHETNKFVKREDFVESTAMNHDCTEQDDIDPEDDITDEHAIEFNTCQVVNTTHLTKNSGISLLSIKLQIR